MPSTLSSCCIRLIACTAASHPARWPEHSWRGPLVSMRSGLTMFMTALLMILRITSPTPMGRMPGFLSNGIKREDVYACMLGVKVPSEESTTLNFLARAAIALQRSLAEVPYDRCVNSFLHASASRPEGPAEPLTEHAIRRMRAESRRSKMMWL